MLFNILKIPPFEATIFIWQNKFDSPEITNKCKCDTLLEYVKYEYENTISKKFDDFFFINDNQTTLTNANISAIQLEYDILYIRRRTKGFNK